MRKYGDAITVKKILQKSHNLGTVNVSERLSKEDMFETWMCLNFRKIYHLPCGVSNY